MVNFYPFLFRFGISFNYAIPKEIISSIVAFFEKKYEIDINLMHLEDGFDCIAINDNEAKNCAPILAQKFKERLEEYKIIDFDNSIFFIDIEQVYSYKFVDTFLIPELIKIKEEKINGSGSKGCPKFILYFDNLYNHSLTYDKLFSSHASYGILDYCFVFDKNGKVLNSSFNLEEDKKLHELIKDISTSSLEKFQFKLVRKINHFKRLDKKTDAWIACQQFFYEGRNCQDEVYRLLMDELMRMLTIQDINPHYIIYDSLYSTWLSKAIVTVANYISSESQSDTFSNFSKKQHPDHDNHLDLNIEEDSRNRKGWKNENVLEIVFICDLIHTGNTFKTNINKVKDKFPNSHINCLSALITDLAYEEYKKSYSENNRKIKIDEFEIRYFTKVDQIHVPKAANQTDCNMCKHELLPQVETSTKITNNLSSFVMYLMSEESGYKIEDYRPRIEREIINRIMPNSLKLFKKNGALLAIKFEQQLKLAQINPNEEIVIVFPDETKNNPESGELPESIEKTPSGYFAKSLNFYNENYSYLGVPREMIRPLEEKSSNLNEIKNQFPEFFKRIENIYKPIVIIDEVNFSGKTFRTITDILKLKGKYPVCYFPVFNFDKRGTDNKYENNQYQSIKFLNLYELDFTDE